MNMGQNVEDQSSCPQSAGQTPQATPPSVPAANASLNESSQPSSLPEVSGPPPKKPRKARSLVWNHFEKMDVNGVAKARCLHCNQRLSAYVPSPHTKEVMAQVLLDCFNAYNIAEKISAIVVDNLSTNDAMVEILRERFDSSSLIMDGEFLHMRCSAHILNLIVQDGMSVIDKGIEKIRDCVLFWTATPKRVEKFEDKIRASKLDCSRKLSLDCKTRWNSIYLMLQSALPYKDVFAKLKIQNPSFKFVIPSDEEWNLASTVCKKLELFYSATKLFSGRNYPTANLFFKQVSEIKINLEKWLSSDELVVRSMASKMLEKFDKYWTRVNGILAIAAVLDPRDKLECVDFYFSMIYGDMADIEIERVRTLLYRVLCEYQEKDSSSNEDYDRSEGRSDVLGKRTAMNDLAETAGEVSLWDLAKKNRKKKVCVRSELDIYLEDSALRTSKEFDVLHYWKLDLKYPTLRKVAKDILAIPASTVASESAFSVGGRMVSPHRSKLKPDTVEALMCLQNWIVEELAGYQIDNVQAYGTCTNDSDVLEEESTINNEVIDPIEGDEE